MGGERAGGFELAAALAVGADKVGVAEKRKKTARRPVCAPSPCSVKKVSLTV
jgi:hypothetical protein